MIPYEDLEQKALIEWAKWQPCGGAKIGDYLVHIPNGGSRDPAEAAKLKAMGVRAGDLSVYLADYYCLPVYGEGKP